MTEQTRQRRGGLLHSGNNSRTINASPGFTLFEFVLVIILISILVASAAPKFIGTSGFTLEGAAAMMTADLRYAQELAMTTHDNKQVVFTNGGSSYTVETTADGVFRTVNLPSRVTISSANTTFTFNPLGEPSTSGGWSVTISAAGNTRTMSVENYTGKVTVS